MVGFGADGPGGRFGIQRVGASVIASVDDELLMATGEVDTRHGDSGGPVFMSYEEPDGSVSPRVVGITSAGSETDCGSGVSHYVNLPRRLSWLEDATGADVTPCFDGDDWSPTPECTARLPREADVRDEGAGGAASAPSEAVDPAAIPRREPLRCEALEDPALLSTCGEAFSQPSDRNPPALRVTSPSAGVVEKELGPNESYFEFELGADASDDGWGVRAVTFTLLAEEGAVEFERVDEVPPYGIRVFRVPPGSHTLEIEAEDHAGNSERKEVELHVTAAKRASNVEGCQFEPRGTSAGAAAMLLLLLALVSPGAARRRGGKRQSQGTEGHRLQYGDPSGNPPEG